MIAWLAGAVPAAAQDSELVLDEQSGYILPVTIGGRTLRLRVDPGAPSNIVLNRSVAQSLALEGREGPVMAVGPLRMTSLTRVADVTIGGRPLRLRLMWFDGDVVEDADGAINPAQLPWRRTVFRLRPATAGEAPIRFRALFDRERGLHHQFQFGGFLLLTRFTLTDPLSTVTAAAGSVIARRRGGTWTGPAFMHKVRFNIRRPARNMVLDEPLRLNGLLLTRLTVRTEDDGGNYRLPAAERFEETDEQADVVVVGQRGFRLPDPAHFWMMIGLRDLEHCSSISYDRGPHRITLMCRPQAAAPRPA